MPSAVYALNPALLRQSARPRMPQSIVAQACTTSATMAHHVGRLAGSTTGSASCCPRGQQLAWVLCTKHIMCKHLDPSFSSIQYSVPPMRATGRFLCGCCAGHAMSSKHAGLQVVCAPVAQSHHEWCLMQVQGFVACQHWHLLRHACSICSSNSSSNSSKPQHIQASATA